MPDRENVILGIENCLQTDSVTECSRTECPFIECRDTCLEWLLRSAFALLKEQESRVLTLSEINKNSFVWYENKKYLRLVPALVVDCQCITRHKFIVEDVFFDVGTYMPEDVHYGKSWRCWNYKPTDEQRKAMKWDD